MYLTPPLSLFSSFLFFSFQLSPLYFLEAWLMSPLLDTFLGRISRILFYENIPWIYNLLFLRWNDIFSPGILLINRVSCKFQNTNLVLFMKFLVEKRCARTPESPSFDIFLLCWFNGCPFLGIDVELTALRGLIMSYNWVDVLLPPLNANSHLFDCQCYLQYIYISLEMLD